MTFKGVIYNPNNWQTYWSHDAQKSFTIDEFKAQAIEDIQSAYTGSSIEDGHTTSWVVDNVDIRIVTDYRDIQADDHVIEIVQPNLIGTSTPGYTPFYGKRILINSNFVGDIAAGTNTRSLPHELGHSAGLEHPHPEDEQCGDFLSSQSPDWIINPANTENLMNQTWFEQDLADLHPELGINPEAATFVSKWQIESMYNAYSSGKLNVQNNYDHSIFSYIYDEPVFLSAPQFYTQH